MMDYFCWLEEADLFILVSDGIEGNLQPFYSFCFYELKAWRVGSNFAFSTFCKNLFCVFGGMTFMAYFVFSSSIYVLSLFLDDIRNFFVVVGRSLLLYGEFFELFLFLSWHENKLRMLVRLKTQAC